MTVWTWYAMFVMAVTLLCLLGAAAWPHITAMWAAARMGWMEIRKGTRR